jgi:hypothetical protein
VSRIFNARGIVVIDYDQVEAQIETYLVMARTAGCRCITVNVPTGQLLYLGSRTTDALAAIADSHCAVFYSNGDQYHKHGARDKLAKDRK